VVDETLSTSSLVAVVLESVPTIHPIMVQAVVAVVAVSVQELSHWWRLALTP
jgi:hypothetical protein